MPVRMLHWVSAKDDDSCCDDENLVQVFADGSCGWVREFQLSITHCPMELFFFPFDQQWCDIVFESKTSESTELDLIPVAHDWMLTLYQRSGEWDLIGKTILPVTCTHTVGSIVTRLLILSLKYNLKNLPISQILYAAVILFP